MEFAIRKVTLKDFQEEIYHIRQKVFIEEQECPEHAEWVEEEEVNAVYFLCLLESKAVACIRIRKMGKSLLKLERVAVLKEFRRRGIASQLIRKAIEDFQKTAPNCSFYAYAQVTAIQTYIALGFVIVSGEWFDEGSRLMHQTIFWSTPHSRDVFLKNESENQMEVEKNGNNKQYENYEIHHPEVVEKIRQLP